MPDRELVRMAAFKLQEAARRMKSLARKATTPEARERFEALADELYDREGQLLALLESAAAGAAPAAGTEPAPGSGSGRRSSD